MAARVQLKKMLVVSLKERENEMIDGKPPVVK
jgi:hypothetical protein